MSTERLQSSKEIIAKVYRDLNPASETFDDDALEWIGEALELIGALPVYAHLSYRTKTENYRTFLPCDLVHIKQVGFVDKDNEGNEHLSPLIASTGYSDTGGGNPIKHKNHTPGHQYKYQLNGNYLITEEPEQDIVIFYAGIATDEDGEPMVPAHSRFSEAVFWYITRKLLMRGDINPVFDYKTAEQYWLRYCAQARANALYPTPDEYEAFSRSWTRMLTERHHHDQFYELLGNRGDTRVNNQYGQYGNDGIIKNKASQ